MYYFLHTWTYTVTAIKTAANKTHADICLLITFTAAKVRLCRQKAK
jgi:hypothetical protein